MPHPPHVRLRHKARGPFDGTHRVNPEPPPAHTPPDQLAEEAAAWDATQSGGPIPVAGTWVDAPQAIPNQPTLEPSVSPPPARYTVEPGRTIYRDGNDFITIERDGDVLTPAQADAVTHRIAELLNQFGE